MVSFAVTDGSVLMLVWIFCGTSAGDEENDDLLVAKFAIDCEKRKLRGSWKRSYAFTTSGYSNKVLHVNVIWEFGKIWKERHLTDFCWLFGDQLAAHKGAEMVQNALND